MTRRKFTSSGDNGELRIDSELTLEPNGAFSVIESWSTYAGAGDGGRAYGSWTERGDDIVLSIAQSNIEMFRAGTELVCTRERDALRVGYSIYSPARA